MNRTDNQFDEIIYTLKKSQVFWALKSQVMHSENDWVFVS